MLTVWSDAGVHIWEGITSMKQGCSIITAEVKEPHYAPLPFISSLVSLTRGTDLSHSQPCDRPPHILTSTSRAACMAAQQQAKMVRKHAHHHRMPPEPQVPSRTSCEVTSPPSTRLSRLSTAEVTPAHTCRSGTLSPGQPRAASVAHCLAGDARSPDRSR